MEVSVMGGLRKRFIEGMAAQINIGRTLIMSKNQEANAGFNLQLLRDNKNTNTNDDIYTIYSDIEHVGKDMKIVADKYGVKYGAEKKKQLSVEQP